MRNYDFSILSAYEFEDFTRDLLQAQLSITFEAFASVKDEGIDARLSYGDTNNIILQAKRINKATELITKLKKEELPKVEKLKPKRYILCTSASLTKGNIDDIYDIFKPYIKNRSDIIAKEQLNNLLSKHPKIEQDYYKLWLSSTDVLTRILHNDIFNRSRLDKRNIVRDICLFVPNKSVPDASKILENNRVLIISGVPGIGKTTLARILCYKMIADNPTIDFISLGQNISEGFKELKEDVPQLFLFDDFLGSNFLVNNLNKNEDSDIIKFLDAINKSTNKYLICTTREYILQQAQQYSEKVHKDDVIRLTKYIVDLSSYTTFIRAQILYNHLFFSGIPEQYLHEIVKDKNYLKIINHKNYNPRLIESLAKKSFVEGVSSEKYMDKIMEFLENSEEIWIAAFEDQISDLARTILISLAFNGSPITYEALYRVVDTYTNTQEGKKLDPIAFDKALKKLDGTFIKMSLEYTGFEEKEKVIMFQNPSIEDFLSAYVAKKNFLIKKYLEIAPYMNFFYANAVIKQASFLHELEDLLNKRLLDDFQTLEISTIRPITYVSGSKKQNGYKISSNTVLDKVQFLLKNIELTKNSDIDKLLVEEFKSIPHIKIHGGNIDTYIWCLKKLSKIDNAILKMETLQNIFLNMNTVEDIQKFTQFKDVKAKTYYEFAKSNNLEKNISLMVEEELVFASLNYRTYADLQEFIETVEFLDKDFKLNFKHKLIPLRQELEDLGIQEDQAAEYYADMYGDEYKMTKLEERETEDKISGMFNTLI